MGIDGDPIANISLITTPDKTMLVIMKDGKIGLARSGLLDDRRHTSNDPHWLASSGYRGASRYVQEPAVDDRGVITASVTASLEFARLILARLEVFPDKALDAWYRLFKTGSAACYFEFTEALG